MAMMMMMMMPQLPVIEIYALLLRARWSSLPVRHEQRA
jgi:hypothetical protein